MSTESKEQKKNLKVYVKMHDGTRLLGMFYLSDAERLQDVMNDERSFLPLHAYDDKGHKQHTLMLAKRYIEQVEEFDGKGKEPSAAYTNPAAYEKPAVAERSTPDADEWTLDETHYVIKRTGEE
jgi:hypothetical protein